MFEALAVGMPGIWELLIICLILAMLLGPLIVVAAVVLFMVRKKGRE